MSWAPPPKCPERGPSDARYDHDAGSSLEFFRRHTIEYLAGLVSRQLATVLLRAIDQSDVLYHAAVAMGSIHKTAFSRQSLITYFEEDSYAVKQYNRSLRILARQSEPNRGPLVNVALIACLLFTGFEVTIRLSHPKRDAPITLYRLCDAIRASSCSTLIPVSESCKSIEASFAMLNLTLSRCNRLYQSLLA